MATLVRTMLFGSSEAERGVLDLTYIIAEESHAPSFDPVDSDALYNVTYLEQLVGTLIKYNNAGQFEHYLAKRWQVSPDGKTWTFFLREGLSAEDGTPINAETYINGLKLLLRLYVRKLSIPPTFSDLTGWQAFLNGSNELKGLHAKSEFEFEMDFDRAPDGLDDYLSMPYYGFYSSQNFDDSGNWRDRTKIISSGAYALDQSTSFPTIRITKRAGWFSLTRNAANTVNFVYMDYSSATKLKPNKTIIRRKVEKGEPIPSGFVPIVGTPGWLFAFVLSPKKKNFFDRIANRKLFVRLLRRAQEHTKLESDVSRPSNHFYAALRSSADVGNVDVSPTTQTLYKPTHPLAVTLTSALSRNERGYVERLLAKVLAENGIKYSIIAEEKNRPDWLDRLKSNEHFDIRFARVDTGSVYINWVVKMMFCSKMGVSFPDPSGRICQLVNEVQSPPNRPIEERTWKEFNRIIEEDAVVVPLFHSGMMWLFSEDIDASGFAPTQLVPRFDLLRLE